MGPFLGWANAMVWDRIADLHREAERERLARRVVEGRARPAAPGGLSTRAHWGLEIAGGLRRLLGSRRPSNVKAKEGKRYVPTGKKSPIEMMSHEA